MLPSMVLEAHLAVIDGAGHMGPLTHGAVVSELIAAYIGAVEAAINGCNGSQSLTGGLS
jgi:hypothetical protein